MDELLNEFLRNIHLGWNLSRCVGDPHSPVLPRILPWISILPPISTTEGCDRMLQFHMWSLQACRCYTSRKSNGWTCERDLEGLLQVLFSFVSPSGGESRHRTRILDTKFATKSHNERGYCKWRLKFAEWKGVCDLRWIYLQRLFSRGKAGILHRKMNIVPGGYSQSVSSEFSRLPGPWWPEQIARCFLCEYCEICPSILAFSCVYISRAPRLWYWF